MRRSRISVGLWGALFYLLAMQSFSLFAAEGTAQLTFQKTAIIGDKTQTYTIRKGDSITRILRKLRMAATTPEVIKRLNPHITNLDRIYPGQKLILTQVGRKYDPESDSQSLTNYTIKKGDSITRIIRYELNAEPDDLIEILSSVKRLNPEIENLNKIYPGQILKIPGGSVKSDEAPPPASVTAASDAGEKAPPAQPAGLSPKNNISLIGQIVRRLNSTVIGSGNYYIPLPGAGQVTIDCATTPVIELEDGTTVFLDFDGRLPDDLAKMVRASWPNYHFLKIGREEDVTSVLRKIILQSKSYTMEKADKPLFLEDEPQVKLFLDWLITKKELSGTVLSRLCLVFAADKSQLLPRPILAQAKKKGIDICEILKDKVQETEHDKAAPGPAIMQIKGDTNEVLLQNFLVLLGLEPLKNRAVKIFDARKDGFDISIEPELLVKRENKTLLVHKNQLPQQFIDTLRMDGTDTFYLAGGMSRKNMLEGVLVPLGIPYQFALFSMPEQGANSRFAVSFFALKIASDKGQFYLIDFDPGAELFELLVDYWKLGIVRY
ncbi:MAG TPA: LysM peptidoglycan-binding domain-containing protein [Syntrophales bacterium]|nr:LysM peptidoglycan-binding domain-containing protein [Syntrophales bacterium]